MPQPRPELENPPEVFYNSIEAKRYTISTRVQHIQREMTLRALELLHIDTENETGNSSGGEESKNNSSLLLDIGCGSGISGDVLTEAGHAWLGVDISDDMLRIAKEAELKHYGLLTDPRRDDRSKDLSGSNTRPDTSGVQWGLVMSGDSEEDEEREDMQGRGPHMVEVVHNDIGQGIPFRPGTFDGCVSISVIQWLCHSSKRGEVPQRRLMALFQSLYNSLRRGAKAVLQFYPSSPEQTHMITRAAMKCGFSGGVVVDYPHSSKARKHYLVLQAGQVAGGFIPPPGLTGLENHTDEEDENSDFDGESDSDEEGNPSEMRSRIQVAGRDRERVKRTRRAASAHGGDRKRRRKDNRPVTGTKEWVLLKKEERRRRGFSTTEDTKYTMRSRKPRF